MKKLKKELLLTLYCAQSSTHPALSIGVSYPFLNSILEYSSSSIREVISSWVALGVVTAQRHNSILHFTLSARGMELVTASFSAFFAPKGQQEPDQVTVCICTAKTNSREYQEVASTLAQWGTQLTRTVWIGPPLSTIQQQKLYHNSSVVVVTQGILAGNLSQVGGIDAALQHRLQQYEKKVSTELLALKQMQGAKFPRPTSAVKKIQLLLHLFAQNDWNMAAIAGDILPHSQETIRYFNEFSTLASILFVHLLLHDKTRRIPNASI
ncbi:hypothetical protein KBD71_04760 [Candidatus Woesebacteria bacterium]|nr:hypothetical protein [Candidatus Woesebacteria bacterium]